MGDDMRELVAAQYVLDRVRGWVDDIRAASYPHPPESYGLQYTYFVATLDKVQELLGKPSEE
jgi:hypothetical protein